MLFRKLLLLLIACPALLAVEAGDLRVEPAAGPWTAAVATDPALVRGVRFEITDGKRKEPVALDAAPSADGARWTGEGLEVAVALRPVGRCVVWDMTVTNAGGDERWLELGPVLALARGRVSAFFDGWESYEAPAETTANRALAGPLPLAVAWSEAGSVAAGLEPSQLVSYFRNEYRPLDADSAELAHLVRLVVRPGATQQVSFITAAAPGEWGKEEILEAYYESFPQWFRPHPEVDPRASLNSSQYRVWPPGTWSPEIARRLYGGWEWCYAPFRRTGDIVGRAELWDYEPVRPFSELRAQPRDEYLSWREAAFLDGEVRCDVGMMFYIPAQIWVEERLAKALYPDSLTTDPKERLYFDTPWVTGNDNELRVFPYRTTFGEASRRDMAEVARELALSGFAFDTAGDAARYSGPAIADIPELAWDDEVGVYASEMVAIAHLMDFVHTLEKDGRPLAVVSNPMANGSYASCFHSDSAMVERSPWSHGRNEAQPLRWKMGQKTLVWWEGYEVKDFIDAATITPEQLATVYQGLADFTLLQSLRLGYLPTPNFSQGVGRLVAWLPALVDCVQTGWQPVPAARVAEPLWSSRYGTGLSTRIAVAHETGEPQSADIAVQNGRLGGGALLFSHYDGRPLTNRVEAGDTRVAVDVPVRTPVLMRAWLRAGDPAVVTAGTLTADLGATAGTLTATLTGRGRTAFGIATPSDWRVEGATWNGQPLAVTPVEGRPTVDLALEGEGTLTVRFVSPVLRLSDDELLSYPFVTDGAPSAGIVVEAPAAGRAAAEREALRVQEYFRYWYGRALADRSEVLLPVGEPVAGRAVRVRLGAAVPAVRLDGGDLVIEAPDARSLELTMEAMLRALDTRYWTPDWFPATAVREALAAYRPEG